jgi:transposase
MEKTITWVGVDAHKKTLAVAVLRAGKLVEEFTIDNDEKSIRKLVRRLERVAGGGEIRICYEAGTCGYSLQRRFEATGKVVCEIIAPSLIPRKAGERIKTDRRDARKLAELNSAGLLTVVSPPTPEQESIRDLCRCREDIRADVGRCRHRLVKMLVRRGHTFVGTRLWTERHRAWLRALIFENAVDMVVIAEYTLAVEQSERRLAAIDKAIEAASKAAPYAEHVGWLRCFHGIDTTVAMIFVSELHGVERFDSPRKLAAYLGLVPSLYASGEKAQRGGITKTGNQHVRRAIVQSSWQYRHSKTNIGVKLRDRRKGQPERVLLIADEARRRLGGRYQRLTERGKSQNKIVIAIARELVGFLWAAMREDIPITRHGARSSTQLEGVKASAAPRSTTKVTPISKTEVGPRRAVRKEKRAS